MEKIYFLILILFSIGAFGQIEHNVNYTNGTVSNLINNIDSIYFNGSETEMKILLDDGSIGGHKIEDIINVTFSGQAFGLITFLDCEGAIINGDLVEEEIANDVTVEIEYTGGNNGAYSAQTINSTGVTGLTAGLSGGNFANGEGILIYEISGTPSSGGLASFVIEIGGQTCTLHLTVESGVYPSGTVHCNTPTDIIDVTNPVTGMTWMDRNLGASQAAISSTDEDAYGDLYQWGRGADGHQCRTSQTTSTLSSTDQPGHGDFIILINNEVDWRSPENTNLWQGVNGINNPCPNGYRIPTEAEFNTEMISWSNSNSTGAFASPLKLPMAGCRQRSDGLLQSVGSIGLYWSSSFASNSLTHCLSFSTGSSTSTFIDSRGEGNSVRCIKEPSGSIGIIDCGGALINGALIEGVTANDVSIMINYIDGNGDSYYGQTVNSNDVTGLTAELAPGNFSNGNGTLIYTISGTPNSSGMASFEIEIGGESCTLEILVKEGGVNDLHCAEALIDGVLIDGVIANSVSAEINYVGGNEGAYDAQTISSTGVTGLTAELIAGNFADGDGSLNYSITGIPNSSGTAIFVIEIGSESCTLEIFVNSGSIDDLDCAGATNNGSLPSGINSFINYTGGNGGSYYEQSVNSTGVTGLTAELTEGNFANGEGTLTFNVIGTTSSTGTASFAIEIGGQTCNLEIFLGEGEISSLDCAEASVNATLYDSIPIAEVSVEINYTGGNGGIYDEQIVTSTGVLGLSATLPAGSFINGAGTLNYHITGLPSSEGIATFELDIGGQVCDLDLTVEEYPYSPEYIHCDINTSIVDVINPTTGRIWMDRNLGASQVATSSTDEDAYGDLFQWGRFADGHQCRTSLTTSTISSTDQLEHDYFILVTDEEDNGDWRNPQNSNLWQGNNGINNPCPNSYRIPTISELENERTTWDSNNSNGAFASPLKLSTAGFRPRSNGVIQSGGPSGFYWSSSTNNYGSYILTFGVTSNTSFLDLRGEGNSVRCIKD